MRKGKKDGKTETGKENLELIKLALRSKQTNKGIKKIQRRMGQLQRRNKREKQTDRRT